MDHDETLPRSERNTNPKPVEACYVEDCYSLIITTTFLGPDGMRRCLIVSSIPNVGCARAFLTHMGWADVSFMVA